MTEGKKYKVEKTMNNPYLDQMGSVIDGFTIRVRLFEFDEVHELKTPNLNLETVQNAIEELISNREALRDLG
jgi:hypothetical protein